MTQYNLVAFGQSIIADDLEDYKSGPYDSLAETTRQAELMFLILFGYKEYWTGERQPVWEAPEFKPFSRVLQLGDDSVRIVEVD